MKLREFCLTLSMIAILGAQARAQSDGACDALVWSSKTIDLGAVTNTPPSRFKISGASFSPIAVAQDGESTILLDFDKGTATRLGFYKLLALLRSPDSVLISSEDDRRVGVLHPSDGTVRWLENDKVPSKASEVADVATESAPAADPWLRLRRPQLSFPDDVGQGSFFGLVSIGIPAALPSYEFFADDGKRLLIRSSSTPCISTKFSVGDARAAQSSECASGSQSIEKSLRGGAQPLLRWLDRAEESVFCATEGSPELLNRFAPIPDAENAELSPEAVRRLLLRFAKPGGYDHEKHRSILLGIIKSRIKLKDGDPLIQNVLQIIAGVDPGFYDAMFSRFPELFSEFPSGQFAPCRTSKEGEIAAGYARSYLAKLKEEVWAKNGGHAAAYVSRLSDWFRLRPLAPTLSLLPPAERDEQMGTIGFSLAQGAQREYGDWLSWISPSKLIHLGANAMRPYFGLNRDIMTDVVLKPHPIMWNGSVEVVPQIIGSEPLEYGVQTAYGFWFKDDYVGKVQVSGDRSIERSLVEWDQDSKRYTAQISASRSKKKSSTWFSNAKSPDYASMLKDGKFTGIIVSGSNAHDWSYHAPHWFQVYYERHGFKFKPDEQSIVQTEEFLKEKIASGEADYLIKQEHAGGDERRFMAPFRESVVLKGTKPMPGGGTEVVYILLPTETVRSNAYNGETTYIDNRNLSDWMKEREKNGGGQLIYLNGSCWSVKQSTGMRLATVQSRLFVEVSGETMQHMFSNNPDYANYHFLESLRAFKAYPEMRSATRGLPSEEVLRFPDESEYRDFVDRALLDTDVKMFDSEGKTVHFGSE